MNKFKEDAKVKEFLHKWVAPLATFLSLAAGVFALMDHMSKAGAP